MVLITLTGLPFSTLNNQEVLQNFGEARSGLALLNILKTVVAVAKIR